MSLHVLFSYCARPMRVMLSEHGGLPLLDNLRSHAPNCHESTIKHTRATSWLQRRGVSVFAFNCERGYAYDGAEERKEEL